MRLSRRLIPGSAPAAPMVAPWAVQAQPAWPTRPLRVVNPYSPGGTTDVVTRLMAERLERALGLAPLGNLSGARMRAFVVAEKARWAAG